MRESESLIFAKDVKGISKINLVKPIGAPSKILCLQKPGKGIFDNNSNKIIYQYR